MSYMTYYQYIIHLIVYTFPLPPTRIKFHFILYIVTSKLKGLDCSYALLAYVTAFFRILAQTSTISDIF